MAYEFRLKPLSIEDQAKLVNSCQTPIEKLVVNGLLETGLRVGELANLTKQNFRWQDRITIPDSKGGWYGSMFKTRIIPLTRISRTIFEKWFTFNDKFPVGKRQIERIVQKVTERAGVTAHCCHRVLRHTFAARFIEKGISTRTMMLVLGHGNLATTLLYVNTSPWTVRREFREKGNRPLDEETI